MILAPSRKLLIPTRRPFEVPRCPRCRKPFRQRKPRPWHDRLRIPMRAAAGDRMLDASGNEILDASGNVLLDDGAGNACCCAATFPPCDQCTNWTTNPQSVRCTIAGVSPANPVGTCASGSKINVWNVNGTYTLFQYVGGGACDFGFFDDTDIYVSQDFYNNADCTGGIFLHRRGLHIQVRIQPCGDVVDNITIATTDATTIFFNSANPSPCNCTDGWTFVNDGVGNLGVGGTATVTII